MNWPTIPKRKYQNDIQDLREKSESVLRRPKIKYPLSGGITHSSVKIRTSKCSINTGVNKHEANYYLGQNHKSTRAIQQIQEDHRPPNSSQALEIQNIIISQKGRCNLSA